MLDSYFNLTSKSNITFYICTFDNVDLRRQLWIKYMMMMMMMTTTATTTTTMMIRLQSAAVKESVAHCSVAAVEFELMTSKKRLS